MLLSLCYGAQSRPEHRTEMGMEPCPGHLCLGWAAPGLYLQMPQERPCLEGFEQIQRAVWLSVHHNTLLYVCRGQEEVGRFPEAGCTVSTSKISGVGGCCPREKELSKLSPVSTDPLSLLSEWPQRRGCLSAHHGNYTEGRLYVDQAFSPPSIPLLPP